MMSSHYICQFISLGLVLIAPLSNVPMFYIKYLKVHMCAAAGAIRKLLYGYAYLQEIIHSLKLVDYFPVHRHKPYNNLHISHMHNVIL